MTDNKRIKWQEVIEKVEDMLTYFEHEGIKATLRTVFHRLVSDNTLPNTVSSYQGLSRHLVKARKKRLICTLFKFFLFVERLFSSNPKNVQELLAKDKG